jgi:hypothetical protein
MPTKKSLRPPRATSRIRNVFIIDTIQKDTIHARPKTTDKGIPDTRTPVQKAIDEAHRRGVEMGIRLQGQPQQNSTVSPTTRNQQMKTNKATDAVKPSTSGSKGVRPSTTGMHGDREGRDVSGISRALRAIEDGLRAFNVRRSPAGRAAYAAGKAAADAKIRRDGVNAWIQDRADAKPRMADDMARELEG